MRFTNVIVAAALAATVIGCGKQNVLTAPPSVVTQPGRVAYTADQLVLRVNELENTAIAARKDGSASRDVSVAIVKFCVSFDKVAKVSPDGAKPALVAGFAELKKYLKGKTLPPTLILALTAVDGIVATFQVGVAQ